MFYPGNFVTTPMGTGVVLDVTSEEAALVRIDGRSGAYWFNFEALELDASTEEFDPSTEVAPEPLDLDRLGNPRFLELCAQEVLTHKQKAAGYSGSDNPDTWGNFREAEAWGLTPVEGCLVRMGDKYRRVQNLRRNAANDQVGESIKDTLLDLSNYAKIAVCLIEEEEAAAREKAYLRDKIDTTFRLVNEEAQTGQPLESRTIAVDAAGDEPAAPGPHFADAMAYAEAKERDADMAMASALFEQFGSITKGEHHPNEWWLERVRAVRQHMERYPRG